MLRDLYVKNKYVGKDAYTRHNIDIGTGLLFCVCS
jgi:hypothetical protein